MPTTESPRYPGTRSTRDGSAVVAHIESHISEFACAYPITPSQLMGSGFQFAVANGARNLWGKPLSFIEPESEHSAASACEGAALGGARVTNFTSGQGLVLMKEVLYAIAGKRLPMVFHIGARALTHHALNVQCGHDDVMSVNDCGWGIVFARNVQEVGDLTLIARRAAEASETPFMVCQDGFFTTHTVETCLLPEDDLMREFVGDPAAKVKIYLDPANPIQIGVVQNQDAYMKGKVAQRIFFDRVPGALAEAMALYTKLTGRKYDFVRPYRMEDAQYAIVGMGTLAESAEPVVDYLRDTARLPVGVLHVTCYRPFPAREIVEALRRLKAAAVIERMDDPMAGGNALLRDIQAAFAAAASGQPGLPRIDRIPAFHGGIAGLGGRDIRPGDLIGAFEHIRTAKPDSPRTFALSILHPLAVERVPEPNLRPAGAFSIRIHSVGGFGSVAMARVLAMLLGEALGLYVQSYPRYGAEKKGLPTSIFVTAGPQPVRRHWEQRSVEYVIVQDPAAFDHSRPLDGLAHGGDVFLSTWSRDSAEIARRLPAWVRRTIRENEIRVMGVEADRLAREIAPTPDLAIRMRGMVMLGALLARLPAAQKSEGGTEALFASVREALRQVFGRRGARVLEENLRTLRAGYENAFEVAIPASDERVTEVVAHAAAAGGTEFDRRIVIPYETGRADREIPADEVMARSIVPPGTADLRDFSYIAPEIPILDPEKCVGCMECVVECPDTAILGRVAAAEKVPSGDPTIASHWLRTKKYWDNFEKAGRTPGLFGLVVDTTKCKGCAECVAVCGDRQALKMVARTPEVVDPWRKRMDFFRTLKDTPREFLVEKSLADMFLADSSLLFTGGGGSCMGCGEVTPIRMMLAATGFAYGPEGVGIVAATGCNTVYGSTFPYNPFKVCWANSLFENVAAVAMGLRAAWDRRGWKAKKIWALGGDGAMADIGLQPLSRLLASGMDVKVLVLDTQVYSNTGGQASTTTFMGQDTKFTMHGKEIKGKMERRKELGLLCMFHPETFVAQVTAAHYLHFFKAIRAANEFPGPAVILAYATCQPEHGVADDRAFHQARLAVESRAFPLLVYDPRVGPSLRQRLDISGNPSSKSDWHTHPKTKELVTFLDFAKSEGRFGKHFGPGGEPSPEILAAQEERLANWRLLRELAGQAHSPSLT